MKVIDRVLFPAAPISILPIAAMAGSSLAVIIILLATLKKSASRSK
jgi:ABC-type Fe3+-siderophore transport system permease subunit